MINRYVVDTEFSEMEKKLLFIKNFINENFGEGKFYSKLKTHGFGSLSTKESCD
jgi:hypothetical protein